MPLVQRIPRLWAMGTGAACLLAACSGTTVGPNDFSPPPADDARGSAPDSAPRGAVPPPEPLADAGVRDATVRDASGVVTPDAAADASPDAPRVACSVTFIVTGALVDGLTMTGVFVGGDAAALGHWDPAMARPLTQIALGVWTGSALLDDGARVEFRFLQRGGSNVGWESWGGTSNRVLKVMCGDTSDAGDAGDASTGATYVGQFNVRPPDAT